MEKIEDIILRHGQRGMDVLRKHLTEDYCRMSAEMILRWDRGTVFLTTGFYVAGFAETDGPAGTVFLALALKKLGFKPVIVTDDFCRGFFEMKEIDVLYMPVDYSENWCKEQLVKYRPVGLISVERCGLNVNGDYANMRGASISEFTAETDLLFKLSAGIIPSIGVGDGGNEIGMGNVKEIIQRELKLVPCAVKTDILVIATVSNWGAYGITAYLEYISGIPELFPSFDEVKEYITETVKIGSVDGVTKERKVSVDGLDIEIEKEIIESLRKAIDCADDMEALAC